MSKRGMVGVMRRHVLFSGMAPLNVSIPADQIHPFSRAGAMTSSWTLRFPPTELPIRVPCTLSFGDQLCIDCRISFYMLNTNLSFVQ
jgi:hypothetical protein